MPDEQANLDPTPTVPKPALAAGQPVSQAEVVCEAVGAPVEDPLTEARGIGGFVQAGRCAVYHLHRR